MTSLLVVSGNTAVHVATTNPTDGMADQMTQLLGGPGSIDGSAPIAGTIGSEPVDTIGGADVAANPEQEYAVLAGDYPLKIADQFGITIDELVAYNDWTSVNEFPAVGGIVKIPPGTTEHTAVPETTVLVTSVELIPVGSVACLDAGAGEKAAAQCVNEVGGRSFLAGAVSTESFLMAADPTNPTGPSDAARAGRVFDLPVRAFDETFLPAGATLDDAETVVMVLGSNDPYAMALDSAAVNDDSD